jgi:preprotein translocase subunit SecG
VNYLIIALTILDVLIALGLITTVLLQSGKSAGLSGSIAGGAEAIFGGKKKGLDELLGKLTKILAGAFMAVSLILAFLY